MFLDRYDILAFCVTVAAVAWLTIHTLPRLDAATVVEEFSRTFTTIATVVDVARQK